MSPIRPLSSSHLTLTARLLRCRPVPASLRPSLAVRRHRALSTSVPRLNGSAPGVDSHPHPQKDAQNDREQISTESNEYAKSGTDDVSAGQDQAAYGSNTSDPQEAKEKAGEGHDVNPLDVSPANPDVSSPTSEEEGGIKKKGSEGGGGRGPGGGDSSGAKSGSESH